MNAATCLLTPWRASHRVMRWIGVFMFAAAVSAAAASFHFAPAPRGPMVAAGIYAFGIGYLWVFFFSASALLAIDARQLRLPGMERTIVVSLVAYALLGIALPTLAMTVLGGPVLLAATFAAAATAAGLAFALVPGYVGIAVGIAPALLGALGRAWQFGVWTPHRLVLTGGGVFLLGVLAILIQWPRLLRGSVRDEPGLARCMVFQFRHGGLMRWSGRHDEARLRILQRPAWAQPEIDVSCTGPLHSAASLRVALGGWYAPQTRRGWMRMIRNLLLGLLGFFSFLAISRLGHQGPPSYKLLIGAMVGFSGTAAVMSTVGVPIMTAVATHRRWSRSGTELPLLALLPGLGRQETIRPLLLRAVLARPLAVHGVVLLATLVGAVIFHFGLAPIMFLLLAQLCAALVTVSSVLSTLGDREPSPWATATLVIAFTTLVSITGFVSLISPLWLERGGWPQAGAVETGFVLGFVGLGGVLIGLARRGWHGLQARPHPFLVVTGG